MRERTSAFRPTAPPIFHYHHRSATRMAMVALALSAGVVVAAGCGTYGATTVSDQQTQGEAASGPSLDALHSAAVAQIPAEPVIVEGPPSGGYNNFGVQCTFPAFFTATEAPGLDYTVITISNGESRIVVSVYKDADTAPGALTRLKDTVERIYGAATFRNPADNNPAHARSAHPEAGMIFPDRMPRKVIVEGGRPYTLYEDQSEWTKSLPRLPYKIEKPKELPPSEQNDPDGYTARRVAEWGTPSNTDLFRRVEEFSVIKSVWTRFERQGNGGVNFEGLSGIGHFQGRRYTVTLETTRAGNPPYAAHIVYIYPVTDEPMMRHIIQNFQQSLTFTGQPGRGGAFIPEASN